MCAGGLMLRKRITYRAKGAEKPKGFQKGPPDHHQVDGEGAAQSPVHARAIGQVEHTQLLGFTAVHCVHVGGGPSHKDRVGKVRVVVGPERERFLLMFTVPPL